MTYDDAKNELNKYLPHRGKIATKKDSKETFTIKDVVIAETNENQFTIYCILIPFPENLKIKLPTIPSTMDFVLHNYDIDGLNLLG